MCKTGAFRCFILHHYAHCLGVFFGWILLKQKRRGGKKKKKTGNGKIQLKKREKELRHTLITLGEADASVMHFKTLQEKLQFKFSVALRPQGLLGSGSPGRPPQLSHRSWALKSSRHTKPHNSHKQQPLPSYFHVNEPQTKGHLSFDDHFSLHFYGHLKRWNFM